MVWVIGYFRAAKILKNLIGKNNGEIILPDGVTYVLFHSKRLIAHQVAVSIKFHNV